MSPSTICRLYMMASMLHFAINSMSTSPSQRKLHGLRPCLFVALANVATHLRPGEKHAIYKFGSSVPAALTTSVAFAERVGGSVAEGELAQTRRDPREKSVTSSAELSDRRGWTFEGGP